MILSASQKLKLTFYFRKDTKHFQKPMRHHYLELFNLERKQVKEMKPAKTVTLCGDIITANLHPFASFMYT